MAAGRLTGEVPRAEATQEELMRHMTKDQALTDATDATDNAKDEEVTR
jgi:putative multiple sugar transport system ATP-binding protein